ncbi:hypothetical protein HJB53_04780 [Rhizobium lentis]|nr:hypothetical protein [Rhizobium lentis]MBX4957341.1 hypothetical protein [Rhizobium lentis]MBX4975082.1 hypothetical protein [Rhizobium lentis]MBX4987332.1 hypothetical protein [Rhizobium lentis]MBX5005776.1 hypothetical protein [Rhizobium lentis]MBX5027042.1 hypothetical protein [Rhizobium lentis]
MSSESPFLDILSSSTFTFNFRPEPIAGDLRMAWGISVLLLCVFFSRGKKASFQKLQFLAHSVRLEEGREEALGLITGRYRPLDVSVRVEPWLNRAVAFAHSMGLVSVHKGLTVALTEEGQKAAEAIAKDQDVLKDEREFLSAVAPKLTESFMKAVWRAEALL